jgi:hypothetical protein
VKVVDQAARVATDVGVGQSVAGAEAAALEEAIQDLPDRGSP